MTKGVIWGAGRCSPPPFPRLTTTLGAQGCGAAPFSPLRRPVPSPLPPAPGPSLRARRRRAGKAGAKRATSLNFLARGLRLRVRAGQRRAEPSPAVPPSAAARPWWRSCGRARPGGARPPPPRGPGRGGGPAAAVPCVCVGVRGAGSRRRRRGRGGGGWQPAGPGSLGGWRWRGGRRRSLPLPFRGAARKAGSWAAASAGSGAPPTGAGSGGRAGRCPRRAGGAQPLPASAGTALPPSSSQAPGRGVTGASSLAAPRSFASAGA